MAVGGGKLELYAKRGRQAQPLKLIPLPNSHHPSDNDGCGNPPRAGKLSVMKFVLTFLLLTLLLRFRQVVTVRCHLPNMELPRADLI